MNEACGVWVVWQPGSSVGAELMRPAGELAGAFDEPLCALILGHQVEEAAREALACGARKVYVVDDVDYAEYDTDFCTHAVAEMVKRHRPSTLLIGATLAGRDLAPRLAARLDTGLTADCTGLEAESSGLVAWTRPTFGGNLMARIICPERRPQMGTVRPGVFKRAEPREPMGELIFEKVSPPAGRRRVRLLERRHTATDASQLETARVIVAGGRGLSNAEGFMLLRDLADALGGTVAASRAAVDAGWIPHNYQVGQTGKTVGPQLYVACGISGAVQHLAGISAADTVVAINSDPEAPIFKVADYGIVGDVNVVAPALLRQVEGKR